MKLSFVFSRIEQVEKSTADNESQTYPCQAKRRKRTKRGLDKEACGVELESEAPVGAQGLLQVTDC